MQFSPNGYMRTGICLFILILLTISSDALRAQTAPATTANSKEIRTLLNANNFDAAYKLAKAVVKDAPNSAEAQYWFGAAAGRKAQQASMFTALGYAKELKAAFIKASELDPKHIEARMALMQFHLAAPGIAGGDKAEAQELAKQIDALDPVWGIRARTMLKFSAKDQAGAISELLAGLQKYPANPSLLSMAVGSLEQAQRLPEAVKAVTAAIAASPDDLQVRYQFVKVSALTGNQLENSLAMVDGLLALNPAPADISVAGMHLRRGQILHRLGRKAEGIDAAKRAVAIEPKNEAIKKALAELQKT